MGNLTVDNVSDSLQTSTAYRPFVGIHFQRLLVDKIQKEVASKVKTGIDASGN